MLDKMRVVATGEKELKVRIPLRFHMLLHSIKIMEGQPIQDTVARALEEYFQKVAAERAAAPLK